MMNEHEQRIIDTKMELSRINDEARTELSNMCGNLSLLAHNLEKALTKEVRNEPHLAMDVIYLERKITAIRTALAAVNFASVA